MALTDTQIGYNARLFTNLCCSKRGEDTVEVFFSLLLADVEDLGLDLSFGDLLDFLGEGEEDTLDLTASGEILKTLKTQIVSQRLLFTSWFFLKISLDIENTRAVQKTSVN